MGSDLEDAWDSLQTRQIALNDLQRQLADIDADIAILSANMRECAGRGDHAQSGIYETRLRHLRWKKGFLPHEIKTLENSCAYTGALVAKLQQERDVLAHGH